MPLTRHFYKEDEVAAALFFCILRGRAREAAFWCLEMLDSGLAEDLLRVLRETWLYGFGVRCLGWLHIFEEAAAEDALDPDRFIGLTCGLSRMGAYRDGTMLALLGLREGTHPDRVNGETGGTLEGFFRVACTERRAATAWLAVRGAEKECDAWLEAALEARGRSEMAGLLAQGSWSPWQRRALGVAAACLRDAEFAASWNAKPILELPVEVAEEVEAVGGVLGRRVRRRFPIPFECLYWRTDRGRRLTVYQSNEKELLRLERPAGIWNSGYWDNAAEEHGGWGAVRSDDDAREAFYAAEFPDDIPDEWSAKEREKSHGRGVLQPGGKATGTEWIRRTFGGRVGSYLIWQGVEECLLPPVDRLEEAWDAVGALDAATWNLRGAGKRVLVFE